MELAYKCIGAVLLSILSLVWIYVAVRIGGRAVLRTCREYKQKEKGDKE